MRKFNKLKKVPKSDRKHAKLVSASKPSQTPLTRVMDVAHVDEASETHQKYMDIAGVARPLDDFVCSDSIGLQALGDDLRKGISDQLATNISEIALRVQLLNISPASAAEIDVHEARRKAQLPKRCGVDMISGIRLCPMPHSDESGFGIGTFLVSVYFGNNVRAEVARIGAKSRFRSVPGAIEKDLEWIDSGDPVAMKRLVDLLIMPDFSMPRIEEQARFFSLEKGWGSGRARRGWLMLAALSMLPVRKKLIAAGAGKPIVTSALARAQHRLKQAQAPRACSVHRDGLPHFWAAEVRRLGFSDFAVPLIKLR
jgi:hypothetical protein